MSVTSSAWRSVITLTAAASLVGGGIYLHQAAAGASHHTEASRLAAADCPTSGQCSQPPLPSSLLDPTAAKQIEEPATDAWAAYLCGAGATAVALSYWNIDVLHYPKLTATDPGGTFTYDPNGTNTATDGHGRSYVMYLATQIQPTNPPDPGNWSGAGEVTLDPNNVTDSGANAEQVRDALNWEASGHTANWQNFFYTVSYVSNDAQNKADNSPDAGKTVNAATINSHITADIGTAHKPVIAQVNDGDLPDWQQSSARGHGHLIAVIGYDNNAGTYTYVETCTHQMCGTIQTDGSNADGTGTHTIPQQQLYRAMTDFPGVGGLIW
jgi:hypothetical protein